MHPILFLIPEFEAWIGAVGLVVLGVVFALLARRNREDTGSWWLASICAGAAGFVVLKWGMHGMLGPFPIRLFGILVVLGFLAAAKVMSARNTRMGLLTGDETFDLAFYMLLAGILGARLLHVLQNFDKYAGKILDIIAIWDGGLVWYGGAVAATFFAWYWLAKRNKDLWAVSDSVAVAVPLGHAIGRLGCFMAGCDYGRRVAVAAGESPPWWAVHFPNEPQGGPLASLVPYSMRYDAETDTDVYLHPVQIYLSLFNLATFAVLFVIDRRTKGQFRGRLSALYLISYAVGRGVIEHWRGDEDRGMYFGGALSFSQIVSILVVIAGVMMYRGLKARSRAPGAA
jgi:phosphatidylglycerol:prolipoprotein diacylglycerol transferase